MVLCALDTWDINLSGGNSQYLHRLESLPWENIKECLAVDRPFHSRGYFYSFLLSFPREMGVHPKARSNFRKWNKHPLSWTKSPKAKSPKGFVYPAMYKKQCTWKFIQLIRPTNFPPVSLFNFLSLVIFFWVFHCLPIPISLIDECTLFE